MTLLDNVVLNNNSIYDILNATVDVDLLKEVAESHMEFVNKNTIVLYTSLNENNTMLLDQGKYKEPIIAFEYYEAALGIKQSEYVIKLEYNINDLYDTLHPRAYKEIENIIKKNRLKKSELEDKQIIKQILEHTKYTGVRVCSINPAKKCYTKTHMLFEDSKVAYILKPNAVRVLDKIKKL